MADLLTDVCEESDNYSINIVYSNVFTCILSSTANLVGYDKCTKKSSRSCGTEYFCTHYNENRNTSCKLWDKLCLKIYKKYHGNKSNWFCYHKPMSMDNNTSIVKDRLKELQESVGACDNLIAEEDIANKRLFFYNSSNDKLLWSINSIYF